MKHFSRYYSISASNRTSISNRAIYPGFTDLIPIIPTSHKSRFRQLSKIMRTFIIISFLLVAATACAQTYVPGSFINNSYRGSLINNMHANDSAFKKKWFLRKYSGISTSFTSFRGGNATIFSAPVGLQLNRKLNNNLFAFAGVSAAPSYVNFRSSFMNADFNKTNANSSFKSSALGLYSRAEFGLQYINDERTFSISGSIGVERNNYAMPIYMPSSINHVKQNTLQKR